MFVTDPSLENIGKPAQLTPPESSSRKRSFDQVDHSIIPSDHKHQKLNHIASSTNTPVYYQQPSINYSWSNHTPPVNQKPPTDLPPNEPLSPSSLITDRKAYAGYLTRQKKECNDAEAASIWSHDVESAFMDALRRIPHVGRRKITVDGRPCGRNELISEYIFRKTGKVRTRKQVSSHIQVLKHLLKDDPEFMELVVENNQNKPPTPSPVLPKKDEKKNFSFSPKLAHHLLPSSDIDTLFVPFNFSMYQSTAPPNVSKVFSQLIRPQLESPIRLRNATQLLARFPHISPTTPIISAKTKFYLPITNTSPDSIFKSTLEFLLNHSDPAARHWTCVTKVYTLGNEVLSLVEPVAVLPEKRALKLVLPFANDFWAAFIVGITGAAGAKTHKEAARAVNAITMTQQLYTSADAPLARDRAYATLLWEFEMVTDAFAARTVFRRVWQEDGNEKGVGKRVISDPVTAHPREPYLPVNQMVSYASVPSVPPVQSVQPVQPVPSVSSVPSVPLMFNYYQDPVPLTRPLTAFEPCHGFHPLDSNNLWYPINNPGPELVVKRFADKPGLVEGAVVSQGESSDPSDPSIGPVEPSDPSDPSIGPSDPSIEPSIDTSFFDPPKPSPSKYLYVYDPATSICPVDLKTPQEQFKDQPFGAFGE